MDLVKSKVGFSRKCKIKLMSRIDHYTDLIVNIKA